MQCTHLNLQVCYDLKTVLVKFLFLCTSCETVKCISTISLFGKYSVFTFLLECPVSRSKMKTIIYQL